VPGIAVEAFESLTGCRIVIHDRLGYLQPFVRPESHRHTNQFCEAVKSSGYDPVCTNTDWLALHGEIGGEPEGLVKICPAGLVECVVPVPLGDQLSAVLFAGVRRPGRDLVADRASPRLPAGSIQWPIGVARPSPIGQSEAQHVLECLRQLAARLGAWQLEYGQVVAASGGPHYGTHTDPVARSVHIRDFLRSHFTEKVTLRDLAEHLALSPGRAAHVVREVCGRPFGELLTRLRLSTAIVLLRQSSLPVAEVALLSGFGDVSHFSRTFKSRTGITPGRYRKAHQWRERRLSDAAARSYTDRAIDTVWSLSRGL
jgi:AraC-like DNA-binding protein